MWIAKDREGLIIYEEKPIRAGNTWQIKSGFYFEIPNGFDKEYLGKYMSWFDEPIEIYFDIRKKV